MNTPQTGRPCLPPLTAAALFAALLVIPRLADAQAPTLADRVETISRSVVLVWYQDEETGFSSYGTGFAIDSLGHILTCAHVVNDKRLVTVALSEHGLESNYPARVVAVDLDLDAALLITDAPGLKGLPLGGSAGVRAGDQTGFVGFPLGYTVDVGFGPSLTVGYVAARRRWRVHPAARPLPMIQVDGTVAIGTSGSPLFLVDTGEVVGMMKAHIRTPGPVLSEEDVIGDLESVPEQMASSAGIGLALPIDPLAEFAARNGGRLAGH